MGSPATDPRQLFPPAACDRIVDAIRQAELLTSGEIRVHVEPRSGGLPYLRAQKVLRELGMDRTEARNGVLIYLATVDRQFAVVGDVGIDEAVGRFFWDDVRDLMQKELRAGRFVEGVLAAVAAVGAKLGETYPRHPEDVNELPDAVSFG